MYFFIWHFVRFNLHRKSQRTTKDVARWKVQNVKQEESIEICRKWPRKNVPLKLLATKLKVTLTLIVLATSDFKFEFHSDISRNIQLNDYLYVFPGIRTAQLGMSSRRPKAWSWPSSVPYLTGMTSSSPTSRPARAFWSPHTETPFEALLNIW